MRQPLEYLQAGHVSEKTDAYAFGVVLLELLTGEEAADYTTGEMLTQKLYQPLQNAEEELPPLLDAAAGKWPLPRTCRLARVAGRCLEMLPAARCDVAQVLPELDDVAGRQARGYSPRGAEFDPMTGKLVVSGSGAAQRTSRAGCGAALLPKNGARPTKHGDMACTSRPSSCTDDGSNSDCDGDGNAADVVPSTGGYNPEIRTAAPCEDVANERTTVDTTARPQPLPLRQPSAPYPFSMDLASLMQ